MFLFHIEMLEGLYGVFLGGGRSTLTQNLIKHDIEIKNQNERGDYFICTNGRDERISRGYTQHIRWGRGKNFV